MLCQLRSSFRRYEAREMSDQSQSAELDRVVHYLLSRFLGMQKGGRAYNQPLTGLALAMSGHARQPVADPRAVLKKIGLVPSDLDDLWAVARATASCSTARSSRSSSVQCLDCLRQPDRTLGPVRASQQSEHVLSCWARGLETDSSKRAGRMSVGTVQLRINALHRLGKDLCELRKLADAGTIPVDPSLLGIGARTRFQPS